MTDNKHLSQQWLQPDWPAISGVHALFTTRDGGCSTAPWNAMNLGDHVGDDPQNVAANRQVLRNVINRMSGKTVRTVFMQQVHGCDVQVMQHGSAEGQAFDASVTDQSGVACTIMVADCLPVLIAHRSGLAVAAAHAGWRGLVGEGGHGVLEAVWQAYARQLRVPADSRQLALDTQVWLGPCIGPDAFEVGDEVRQAFVNASPQAGACFVASTHSGKWLANLPQLARQRLEQMGLSQIYGNDASDAWCTVANASRFFSHRRDAAVLGSTGRMAACIWKD
ncbi:MULTISPECIES: peptidoglycan editing factor PgeF [unclassified Comamonas]|uniref:peptidoglycan editing factor PgeF n=1 Tax=unclassified Comamonas TaxID=2638500 RepID=UPI001780FC4C|nr:peptidoglycan editing factor PgeF [Comamonas sp.]MBD9402487.1 peptidoglycan editing factor PgeF [Comamonas sp. CMM02]